MEMTRERLEQYRSNVQEIRELTYKLDHLGEGDSLIGNDVIMDYKKGYPRPQSVVGYDYDLEARRRERYESLRGKLQAENDNIEEFVFGILDGRVRRIFQLYFLEGKSMEQVARKVHFSRSQAYKKIEQILKDETNETKKTV